MDYYTTAEYGLAALLRAARARIEHAASWCQGSAARDAAGTAVAPEHPAAVRWSADGAFRATISHIPDPVRRECDRQDGLWALQITLEMLTGTRQMGVGLWNDRPDTTHAAVLALYDAAIAPPYRQKETR